MGVYYRKTMSPTQFYPFENVINVYHNTKGELVKLEDDHKNNYTMVPGYELETYTWESLPIELHLVRATAAHFHEVSTRPRPIVRARERSLPPPLIEETLSHLHLKEHPRLREEPMASAILSELIFPRAKRTRGRKGGEGKTLRPSTVQKFCKKFDGTWDPYDHVIQYRQLLFAKGITDVHTIVQVFGLTMED